MVTKVLRETLKAADDGRVEMLLEQNGHTRRGYIEHSFFADAFGHPNIGETQKVQFSEQNISYLEETFDRLLKQHAPELVIR